MAILSGLALAGCSREPAAAQPVDGTPLKSLAPFPVGVAVQAAQLSDSAWTSLAATHFTQLTAEWEMKMEYVVQADGSFRFDRADAIAAFARERGMRLFGHTLVWYANEPEAFARLDESRQSFAGALANYVTAMVGRYRGLASGWDVVNEPIRDDGSGPRDSLWSRKLGQIGHFKVAFEAARAADPQAVLFTNDYHLESKPAKLASYMRLIEQLLDAGVPLGGIGCQTHLDADLPAGAITRTLKALAGAERRQEALYSEAMAAFAALPQRQQFAFTVWGLRDGDSWLTRENARDAPLMFDSAGRPKATYGAVVRALRGRG
jgi:endo-1,4-beta-xylanase